jgi:prevent-host-death family protein
MQIAMHVLKAGLSRFVARARAGEVIEVTSHDKPVVRIVGIPAAGPPGITRLMASGAAQWSGGKPKFRSAVKLGKGTKALSEMVLEDRG